MPPLRRDTGVGVVSGAPDAPFSQQGRLQPGDVIYALNGRRVDSVEQIKAAADALKPNTATLLQIERRGTLMYLAFRLER
ncbi:MAG: PDZ domain-containing protein [Acidobacteria bacterium]|nr:PDZ domain-containing protein [Acidobacteriota bacterium]